jgi:hypothetical protein
MYVVSISLLHPLVNQYTALGAFTFIVAYREDFPFVTDFAAFSMQFRILDNLKIACYVIWRAMLLTGTLAVMQATGADMNSQGSTPAKKYPTFALFPIPMLFALVYTVLQ